MQSIDGYKLSFILSEGLERLRFLLCVNKEDDTSSELAGYEINKLLLEQGNLEEKYAELLKVRGTLKGISNKAKLEAVQKEIEELAFALKDSTKKLGRLFRENPDLKKEAEKVGNERVHLVSKLGNVITSLQVTTPALIPTQNDIIAELEDQDALRQLTLKEKGLLSDIKQLHTLLKNEEVIYQNDVAEKQLNVQTLKRSLEEGRGDAEVEVKNVNEGVYADIGTAKRLNDHAVTDLEQKIEKIKEKKEVEVDVFRKIVSFLKDKETQKREEIQEWNTKLENTRDQKQQEIDRLTDIKTKREEDLKKLKEEFERRNNRRLEKEQKYLNREDEKRRARDEEEKLDEAVKAIQERYRAWKEAGGTVKKKKGKKGGKAKAK